VGCVVCVWEGGRSEKVGQRLDNRAMDDELARAEHVRREGTMEGKALPLPPLHVRMYAPG
jgi:hypothetical protein